MLIQWYACAYILVCHSQLIDSFVVITLVMNDPPVVAPGDPPHGLERGLVSGAGLTRGFV